MSVPETQKAIQIQAQGGLEVIEERLIPTPKPGAGQVLIKVEYAGVNFIDTYFRSGIYPVKFPFTLGNEAGGTVVALGEGVTEVSSGLKIGDRVAAYASECFSEYVAVSINKVHKLPEGISTKDAATIVVQGLTALTFAREAYQIKKGDFILVQAAAGGLGLLLVQLAKHLGATVIGTTSTPEKAKIAKAAGADHVILYGNGINITEDVYKITGGEGLDRGVHAVFDGVGKDTFEADFELLRRKGTLVSFGNASGPVPPFAPLKLVAKNLKIARPTVNNYVYTGDEFHSYSKELLELYTSGVLKLQVYKEYPFSADGVKESQSDISSRKTTGKLLVKL